MKREVITIYEIIKDASNKLLYAVPDYQFKCVRNLSSTTKQAHCVVEYESMRNMVLMETQRGTTTRIIRIESSAACKCLMMPGFCHDNGSALRNISPDLRD